jgi:two-component system, NtrC family, nitrogen regulation sensor histidine kinase NtrY
MGIRNFNASIIIHLLCLIIVSTGAGFFFSRNWSVFSLLLVVDLFLVIGLFHLFGKTNRNMAYFFDAVRNNDTSFSFVSHAGNTSVNILHDKMNILSKYFQNIRIQAEYREKYYQMLLQQSVVGLVVLNDSGEVEFINDVACDFADISSASTNKNLLKIKNPKFYELLVHLKKGTSLTYRLTKKNGEKHLFIKAIEISNPSGRIKMVSMHDIKQQLEENELESWQKLISILNHEIMNSVAPITSISKTLSSLYIRDNESIKASELNDVIVSSTVQGLKVIEEQSNGLINFINNYRKLTKIPQPHIIIYDVNEWMCQVHMLFFEKMKDNHINFSFSVDKNISVISADKNLIHQVIVNLLNNAIEAFAPDAINKKISIDISLSKENRTVIRVTNNGPNIQPEILEKIFFPFFTTKENGSGIGLSLSRQIIQIHHGYISVESNEAETSFIIVL